MAENGTVAPVPESPHRISWIGYKLHVDTADGGIDHNAVRLQLHALASSLGTFMRTLALPDAVEEWSLTSLREKLIKIGAKIVRHGRYVTFQMAEVVIPRDLFADILRRIDRLRPPPAPV